MFRKMVLYELISYNIEIYHVGVPALENVLYKMVHIVFSIRDVYEIIIKSVSSRLPKVGYNKYNFHNLNIVMG